MRDSINYATMYALKFFGHCEIACEIGLHIRAREYTLFLIIFFLLSLFFFLSNFDECYHLIMTRVTRFVDNQRFADIYLIFNRLLLQRGLRYCQ